MPAAVARQRRTHHHVHPAAPRREPAVQDPGLPADRNAADLEWHRVQSLVERVALDAPPHPATSVARELRAAHRPLRWSWSFCLAGSLLLGQLVVLLWLQAYLLSARNHRDTINQQMAQMRESMARTQQQIAAVDSQTRVAGWAAQYGWRQAVQADIDAVTPRPNAAGSRRS